MKTILKNAFRVAALTAIAVNPAWAQFAPGQVLTAAQLNTAFANTLPIAGGTLTGPLTVPTLTVTTGATITNTALSGGTINNAAIGATTPSTGAFTTLGATGATTLATTTINGNSTPTSNLTTILDSLSGTVTGTFRPDTFFVNRTYNGSQSTSGYTSAGDALHPYIGYGTTNTSSAGSVALLGGNINVYNSSNGPAGRSEFTPLAVAVVPIKGGTFAAGSNYYNDFNIQSAIGSGGQEGFLASGSFSVQKWTSGNVIDANHAGSYGLSVIATPGNTGYDAQNHASDTTYPLNAMITLNGWSGQQSATSGGGSVAAASAAANVGLQIGGPGGSVWTCATCYSYIPTGIHIQDYTTAAIQIDSPNSGHANTGTAININRGAGNLIVGDSIYVGNASGGGIVQMAQSNVNAPVASTQALTHYQDRGTDKWLIGKQTDNSFVLYDSANAAGALTISATGNVAIGEAAGTTTITSPVANGSAPVGWTGRLLNVQVFSSNGTYTPTAGTAKIIVKVQAPGGSSGGVAATSTGQSAAASGGGAGSYAQALVTSGFSGVAVTVPAGAAAPAAGANNGNAGATASFGSIVSCPGGNGGSGGAAVSAAGFTTAAGQVAACTVSGATTLVSVPGQASAAGWIVTPGTASMGGSGGSSPLGVSRVGYVANGSGIGPTGYGAGGTGANNNASQAAAAGLAGAPALIEIDEYSN